jgi:D-alanyl-D-alanine dipeptidase
MLRFLILFVFIMVTPASAADAPLAKAQADRTQQSKTQPVAKSLPPGFVDVASVAPDIEVDLRYATADNFVGRPIDGYRGARCILTSRAAEALAAVQRDLAERGLGIKLFDCYRPRRAVAHFMRWAHDLADTATKAAYYPTVDKKDLVKEGYIAERSSHSRGSTVDLTLVRLANKVELDMGTPFDFFSPKSWPSDTSVSHDAQFNRRMLFEAMNRRGFRDYEKEWWHFTLANEPHSTRSFDFPIE